MSHRATLQEQAGAVGSGRELADASDARPVLLSRTRRRNMRATRMRSERLEPVESRVAPNGIAVILRCCVFPHEILVRWTAERLRLEVRWG